MRRLELFYVLLLAGAVLLMAPGASGFHVVKPFMEAVEAADLLVKARVVATDTLSLSRGVTFKMDTLEVERVLLNRKQKHRRDTVRPDAFDMVNRGEDAPHRIAVIGLQRGGSNWFTAKPLELHETYYFPLRATSLTPAGIYQLVDNNTDLPDASGRVDPEQAEWESVEEKIAAKIDATDVEGEPVRFEMVGQAYPDAAARFREIAEVVRRFAALPAVQLIEVQQAVESGGFAPQIFEEETNPPTFAELLGPPGRVLAVTFDSPFDLAFADGSTYPLWVSPYMAFPDSPFHRRMRGAVLSDAAEPPHAEPDHEADGLRFYRVHLVFNSFRAFDAVAVRGGVETIRGAIPVTVYLPLREVKVIEGRAESP